MLLLLLLLHTLWHRGWVVVVLSSLSSTSWLVLMPPSAELQNLELAINFQARYTHLSCICLVVAARCRILTGGTSCHEFDQTVKKREKRCPRQQAG